MEKSLVPVGPATRTLGNPIAAALAWSAVALAGVSLAAVLAGCQRPQQQERPASTPGPRNAAPTDNLSPAEESVRKLLEKYASVDRCIDRLALILHGGENRPTLEQYYQKRADCRLSYDRIDVSSCRSIDADGYCYPVVAWRGKGHENHYCVLKQGDGYVIDWRCTVVFEPVSLVTFTAEHTLGKPSLFRVHARLSDVYRSEFAKALTTHHSLSLRGREDKTVLGYVLRASPDGQKIFDQLKDGKEHPLLVELGYPKASTDPGVVEVRKLVALNHHENPKEFWAAPSVPPAPRP